MKWALALAVLAGQTAGAGADPIELSSAPLAGFQRLSTATEFGPLTWRGGLKLSSGDESFGGLSGLSLSPDCTVLLAVSDTGRWLRARLTYSGAMLTGIADAEYAPILDGKGNAASSKAGADAEALADLGNGSYLVGFESRVRTGTFNIAKSGLQARFELVKSPKAITEGPQNGQLESAGKIPNGPWKDYYIAISENNADAADNIRGWLWQAAQTIAFTVKRHRDYEITDLSVLPGGDILILERSFSPLTMPAMAIRRFSSAKIASGAVAEPSLVFEASYPFFEVDNMEGLALCTRHDETRLTIVSDDNLDRQLQRTLLLQFSYRAEP